MNEPVHGLTVQAVQVKGRVAPSPPTPLPRWGRGELVVFFKVVKSAVAPLAPGRGEGSGVRGERPPDARVPQPGL